MDFRCQTIIGRLRKMQGLLTHAASRKEYLDSLVDVMRSWSSCRCVGIRILNRDGGIPYESHVGFSREFWEAENPLNVRTDCCACVHVMRQSPQGSQLALMTEEGSFWCENFLQFASALSKQERCRFRGRCEQEGFASLAIIPIRNSKDILGLIHVADKRPGLTTLPAVEDLELLTPLIGEAIHRFTLEDHRRRLEAEVLAVGERERQRVGQDMHDALGQNLSGIAFLSGVLHQKLKEKSPDRAREAAQIEKLVNESVELTRSLARDLNPAGIRPESLITALRDLAERTERLHGVSCVLKHPQRSYIDDAVTAAHLYRIVQEAVHNAVRQGKAGKIQIQLLQADGALSLAVHYNGAGTLSRGNEMGLGIMRYHAAQIGGKLQIKSQPPNGTRITCVLQHRRDIKRRHMA